MSRPQLTESDHRVERRTSRHRLPHARLARIYRYPVKGLPGQHLTATQVAPGSGIPHDRRFAVANGHRPTPPNGAWTARPAFFHLAKNADLTRIGTAFDGHQLNLHHPELGGLSVVVDDPASLARADAILAEWFPSSPHGPVGLVEASCGYWDHADAALSLINLETVADLAAQAGQDLDPLRFRGNLYLSGLAAWEEFRLVGQLVRVGDAVLEILRPIDRCRAVSVNPTTGHADVNLPALLGARCGHVYCGMYARVVEGGRLATGQPVSAVRHSGRTVTDPAVPASSPTTAQWPRLARVTDRVRESDSVTSFWVRDPLRRGDASAHAGQHLRVHAADRTGPLWRSYTISAAVHGSLRVSVKRDDRGGRMSRLLHDTTGPGDELLISGPFGDNPYPTDPGRPMLLASAGIGITPMIAILRALNQHGFTRPLLLCHTARNATELALWTEARQLTEDLPHGRAQLHLTQPDPGDCEMLDAEPGRPPLAALAERHLPLHDAIGYLCGPPSFLQQGRAALEHAGLSAERLRYEVFRSPRSTAGRRSAPPSPGPFRVHFAISNVDAEWRPDAGTLLDLGEQAGLTLPAGCREGACHTCRQPIATGRTANITEPMLDPATGSALLCCAVPATDVTITA